MRKITFFGLKSGQYLKNWVTHPHQEFPGVPPSSHFSLCELKDVSRRWRMYLYFMLGLTFLSGFFRQENPLLAGRGEGKRTLWDNFFCAKM